MSDKTRREFLKQTALAGGAVTLGQIPLSQAAFAQEPAAMSVARWKGEAVAEEAVQDMAAKLTDKAIEAIGGMGRFVKQGDVVWIKPNMAWNRTPEQAATTNPGVVASLVRQCLAAGAKTVKVGDNTCHEAPQAYTRSGIEAAAKEAGGQVVYLDEMLYRDMDLGGDRLKTWPVYSEIAEADLVINCPIAKHHGLTQATLCMKNYMGVVGGKRGSWHQDIAGCLTDITRFMKPRLCVLDAVRILTANGPQGGDVGDVKRLDTVAAATDIVAIDAFGVELLGNHPDSRRILERAHQAGLGQIDYRQIAFKEIEVS